MMGERGSTASVAARHVRRGATTCDVERIGGKTDGECLSLAKLWRDVGVGVFFEEGPFGFVGFLV